MKQEPSILERILCFKLLFDGAWSGCCDGFPLLNEIVVHARRIHRCDIVLIFQEIQILKSNLFRNLDKSINIKIIFF